MADIKLGLTKKAIEDARETYEGPRTPFPATRVGYTKYTALVTDLAIKEGTGNYQGQAWLWIQVSNGIYQESILINLDPSNVAPSAKPEDVEKIVQRNLDTLLRVVKVLDIANVAGDGIDTGKFAAAKGTMVTFGVRLGEMNLKTGYPRIYSSFYGKAEALIPVDAVPSVAITEDNSDIPF